MKLNKFKRLLSLSLSLVIFSSIIAANMTTYSAAESEESAVAEPSNAEPTKNEYKVVSPVPSGSSITPIEQPSRLDSLMGK